MHVVRVTRSGEMLSLAYSGPRASDLDAMVAIGAAVRRIAAVTFDEPVLLELEDGPCPPKKLPENPPGRNPLRPSVSRP